MKKVILLFFIVAVASCGTKKKKILPPETEITVENAGQVTSFENTPESVVMYYFASRIRKDQDWEKVCIPTDKRSDRMVRQLKDHGEWTFSKYHFVSKKEFEKDKWWVLSYFAVSFKGEEEDGEDEVTVELVDGKWLITEVPT